jgi:hypothetical protein
MGRRDRQRVRAIVPVRIWGTDRDEKPFSEHVCTVNISGTGVRLVGVRTRLSIGDTVGLQYRNRLARFRIVWVVVSGTSRGDDLGLQCLQPEKHIWQTDLPGPAPDVYDAPESKSRGSESRGRDRRFLTRYPISGDVLVADASGSDRLSGKLGDISLTGCYMETSNPWQAGCVLTLMLKIGSFEIRAAGVVRVVYAGVAMGIEFTHLNPADQRALNHVITKLQGVEAVAARPGSTLAQTMAPQQA